MSKLFIVVTYLFVAICGAAGLRPDFVFSVFQKIDPASAMRVSAVLFVAAACLVIAGVTFWWPQRTQNGLQLVGFGLYLAAACACLATASIAQNFSGFPEGPAFLMVLWCMLPTMFGLTTAWPKTAPARAQG